MRTLPLSLGWLFVASAASAQGSFTSIGGPPGGRMPSLIAHPSGSVAMVQDERVFCSFDDGQTWAMPEALRGVKTWVLGREGTALLVLAASGPDQTTRSYLSTDGCASWRDVTGQDTRAARAVKVASGWFVRDDTSGLVRSTDQGATWQATGRVSSLPPQASGSGDVFAISRTNSSNVLVRWSEGSTGWTQLAAGSWLNDLFTGPDQAVAVVRPLSFEGFESQISRDGGATWLLSVGDQYAVAPAFGPDGSVYVGTSRHLVRYSPENARSNVGPDSLGFRPVAVTPAGTVLAAGCRANCYAQVLFRKAEGGAWTRSGPEEATSEVLTVTAEQGRLFAANATGAYERGGDGRWRAASVVELGIDPWLDRYGPRRPAALHLAPWGTVYQLDTWVPVPVGAGKTGASSGQGGAIVTHADTTLLVALFGWDGGLRRSTNRGRTWQAVDSVAAQTLVRLESGRIVAASTRNITNSAQHRLRYTDDGGATWSREIVLESPFPQQFVSLAGLPGTTSVVLATGLDLYRSDDAGGTWARIGDGCLAPALVATTRERGVLACETYPTWTLYGTTDGFRTRSPLQTPRIVRYTSIFSAPQGSLPMTLLGDGRLVIPAEDGGLLVSAWPVANAEDEAPSSRLRLTVSPNPVRSTATLTVQADAGQLVRVEVFDLLGRRWALLYEGTAPGDLSLPVDASGWSAGVYVVRVTSGTEVRVTSVVVQR